MASSDAAWTIVATEVSVAPMTLFLELMNLEDIPTAPGLPSDGWFAEGLKYKNHFNGVEGELFLAWEPLRADRQKLKTSCCYESFGNTCRWHSRWAIFSAPQPHIVSWFGYNGENIGFRKLTTIWCLCDPQTRLPVWRGGDYRGREVSIGARRRLCLTGDAWQDRDQVDGIDGEVDGEEDIDLEDF